MSKRIDLGKFTVEFEGRLYRANIEGNDEIGGLWALSEDFSEAAVKAMIERETSVRETIRLMTYELLKCGVLQPLQKQLNEAVKDAADLEQCRAAYKIYERDYYKDHDFDDTPVCFEEFRDCEWRDDECRKFYIKLLKRENQKQIGD